MVIKATLANQPELPSTTTTFQPLIAYALQYHYVIVKLRTNANINMNI